MVVFSTTCSPRARLPHFHLGTSLTGTCCSHACSDPHGRSSLGSLGTKSTSPSFRSGISFRSPLGILPHGSLLMARCIVNNAQGLVIWVICAGILFIRAPTANAPIPVKCPVVA